MSKTFKSFEGVSGDRTFSVVMTGNGVLATIKPEGRSLAATIAVADAPAVALAILEASGITATRTDTYTVGEPDNLAHIAANLQHHIEARDKAAKLDAEHAELVRRRDDLASAFADCALEFNDVHVTVQRAIDYIIELEDAAAK